MKKFIHSKEVHQTLKKRFIDSDKKSSGILKTRTKKEQEKKKEERKEKGKNRRKKKWKEKKVTNHTAFVV